jgi:quercetin dioxygenase-like cupin family protein
VIRPASSLRGLDQGDYEIFALQFTWAAGTRTSLHKHKGFELVLVREGRLHAIVDGTRLSAGQGEFIELPAGSAHAIWSEAEVTFDVLGRADLA